MTRNYYTTRNYKTNHSTFGGIIYNGDFDCYHSMTDMAKRIESELKFDEQCRKNIKNRLREVNTRKENI